MSRDPREQINELRREVQSLKREFGWSNKWLIELLIKKDRSTAPRMSRYEVESN